MADRDEPETACWEWHGGGTAGEDDRGSGLSVTALDRVMSEAGPGWPEPRWQVANGGAAVSDVD